MTLDTRRYDKILESMTNRLEAEMEKALRKAITKATKGHLKNRAIRFQDAMGMTSIDIYRRDKPGYLTLTSSVYNFSIQYLDTGKKKSSGWLETYAGSLPFVDKLGEIINQYNAAEGGKLYACEFTMEIGGDKP